MKNVLIRVAKFFSCIMLACFIIFGTCMQDIKQIRPLVVHADEGSAWTILGQRWYEFLMAGATAGVYFGAQWTAQTIDEAIKLFKTKQSFQKWASNTTITEDDTKVKIVGDDAILSNKFVTESSKFWETFKSEFGTGVGDLTNIKIGDDTTWTGTYISSNSIHYEDTLIYDYTFSLPARICIARTSDDFDYLVYAWKQSDDFTIRQLTTRADGTVVQDSTLNSSDFDSDSGYHYSLLKIYKSYPAPIVSISHANSAPNYLIFRDTISYLFGPSSQVGSVSATNIGVYNNGNDKTQGYIDDSSYGMLVPTIAKGIDATNIASDGTVSGDIINSNIEKRVSDDAIATPINPAVPATYPLADTADIAKPVNPAVYNPPSSVSGSSYGVVGLQDVFPFCIPFDMVNFVSALNADPVAPVVTFPLHFAGILDYDLTIDLNQWNSVASVFRGCELALSVMGLFFITRWMLGDK